VLRTAERPNTLKSERPRLNMLLPVALAYLGEDPPDERRQQMGSPGWEINQQVASLLMRMESAAREVSVNAGEKAQSHIDDVMARYLAAPTRLVAVASR
jgi:hypothetical protein